ncbi:MAG: quinone-dependent dihydroorotate dehydrogenase [Chthoniobacterales bacterium]
MSVAAAAYERLIRPGLFSLDAERAHELTIRALSTASRSNVGLIPLRGFAPPDRPVELFGLTFRNRVGLAAGMDKNGVALPAWEAMGFGFLEIGTVTAHTQPGNPRPRIFRYPDHQGIINRLGFNNDGAVVIAARLRSLRESGRWPRIPVGINIGKSKITPLERAADDYRLSFQSLREFADYVVLNVSSPNTPGLRDLQQADHLVALLDILQNENRGAKPLFVKIAPDLATEQLEQIIATCEGARVAGLIATNTTLDHTSIARSETGGLSGAPLLQRSNDVLRLIRARSALPVIGVGGIVDAASARSKIEAGAQLIQIYTGLIFRGPALIREVA